MRYRVIMVPEARRAFRDLVLGRSARVRALVNAYHDLENHANQFRPNRWPKNPELFV